MKKLREKVSYLKGLSEGLETPVNTREGNVLGEIIEVMEDLVYRLDDLQEAHAELETYLEAIDADLYDLEGDSTPGLERKNLAESDWIELECPRCHDLVSFSADLVEDADVIEVSCPTCAEVVYINDGSYDLLPAMIENQPKRENVLEDPPVTEDI